MGRSPGSSPSAREWTQRTSPLATPTVSVLHVTIPASFTGRFRAGKAPEVLVGALALLAAPPPACPRLRLAANQLITFHHPDISRGPQALKVRTGRG